MFMHVSSLYNNPWIEAVSDERLSQPVVIVEAGVVAVAVHHHRHQQGYAVRHRTPYNTHPCCCVQIGSERIC